MIDPNTFAILHAMVKLNGSEHDPPVDPVFKSSLRELKWIIRDLAGALCVGSRILLCIWLPHPQKPR